MGAQSKHRLSLNGLSHRSNNQSRRTQQRSDASEDHCEAEALQIEGNGHGAAVSGREEGGIRGHILDENVFKQLEGLVSSASGASSRHDQPTIQGKNPKESSQLVIEMIKKEINNQSNLLNHSEESREQNSDRIPSVSLHLMRLGDAENLMQNA